MLIENIGYAPFSQADQWQFNDTFYNQAQANKSFFILIFYQLNLFHWFLRLENTRGEVTQCVLQQGQVAAIRREEKSLWQVPLFVLTLKNAFLAAKNCH